MTLNFKYVSVSMTTFTCFSNVQTPYFLWDGSTRGELLKYLEDQVESGIRSGVTPVSFTFTFLRLVSLSPSSAWFRFHFPPLSFTFILLR